MSLDEGHYKLDVQRGGSLCLRRHEPDDEKKLRQIIQRDSADEEVGEKFNHGEDRKHAPVREPLRGALRCL